MGVTGFDKFKLLMWKNWLLQWRHPCQTAVEILSPVIFSVILVLLRSLVVPTTHTETTYFKPFDINTTLPIKIQNGSQMSVKQLQEPLFQNIANINFIESLTPRFQEMTLPLKLAIIYSPENEYLRDIVTNVQQQMDLFPYVNSYKSSSEMNNFFVNNNLSQFVLCGIQFDDSLVSYNGTSPKLPKNLKITLRFPGVSRFAKTILILMNWKTNVLFPLLQSPGPRLPQFNDGGYPPGYHSEGFLAVQHHLSYAIINYYRNKTMDDYTEYPKIKMQRYPYPPYIEDPLLLALSGFMSLIIMLSFVYSCINTVKVITAEKERQLKEAMKIMGLPNWLHWTAWFTKSFIFMLISVFLIVLLLKIRWIPGTSVSIFTQSDATLIFFFLVVYICASISFCFLISVFFSKANVAATIAGLMWFLSYSPFLFLQQRYESLSLLQRLVACIASNTAMSYGFQLIIMYEGTSQGMQWSSVFKSFNPNDQFALGYIIIMLIGDAIFYILIALYVEGVCPGEYGIPRPWNFPFTSSYWCGVKRFAGVEDKNVQNGVLNKNIYEPAPTNIPIGVQIKHLRKEFGKKKVAVHDLNLNLYEGQITVLLGHNGAGKTTTMSMLTGMYPPTSGTAVIAGHDIITDMAGVRASLGLCPQHNILFDELTVKEHIYFFSKLKGLNQTEIEIEIHKYITMMELVPKVNAKAKTLSGGMKRKLSTCVALCGHSKVVILDEPTAGMDPSARRALWDVLQEEKKNRTMLLSTHFMDEADLLGDRIAIMAEGNLQCVGSSFFLKKRYGTGYHLTMEKSPQCNTTKVTQLLDKYIPNIHIENSVGSELTYILTEDKISIFETMLKDLESHSRSLGILNYGISLTTLEEVFMKVGADRSVIEEDKEADNSNPLYNDNVLEADMNRQSSDCRLNAGDKLISGCKLYVRQFQAMMMKKMFSTIRSWILLLVQILLPVSFIIIAIVVSKSWNLFGDLPPMDITMHKYHKAFTVINGNNSTFKDSYTNILEDDHQNVIDIKQDSIEDYILERSDKNLFEVRLAFIVGATFGDKTESGNQTIIGWFNNELFHATPLALNLIHNSILKSFTDVSHSISITNYPQPYTLDTKLNRLQAGANIGFQIAFNIGFSMAFVTSFYVLFCIRERMSKSKHLQFVSGVNILIFWICAYIWDMITFIFTSLILVCVLAMFQEDGYATFLDLSRLFATLVAFGHSMLPLMYLTSFTFKFPSTGYTRMTLLNIFTGVAAFLVVEVLRNPALNLGYAADIVDLVFLGIPQYSISNAINNLNKVYTTHKLCEDYAGKLGKRYVEKICQSKNLCCDYNQSYFAWKPSGIGRNITVFIAEGLLLFILLLIIEFRIIEMVIYTIRVKKSSIPPELQEKDDDVNEERKKINNMSMEEIKSHQLVMKDFSKYYRKFLAVQRLSLAVKGNECFGLLGINGAGKTSTFKMLTGDEKISFGEAWTYGLSLKTSMKEVHKLIGYCPQFDALLDDLTGRETLKMYCLLRGVKNGEVQFVIKKLAREFAFTQHLDKRVRHYSGGNKRKLSTAVSLIGDPCLIYLDEPTTGMDPGAKRHFWNALCKIRDNGKCIILTSHSMEECEALCTRLAIMVNGGFKCLGSTQHLKSKFSSGYTLTVKVKKTSGSEILANEIEPIDVFIKEKYPSAVLREKYEELLTYYISDTSMAWSQMFGIMEAGKKKLQIEDYSLGQASLEQVFLKFTKHQRDELH